MGEKEAQENLFYSMLPCDNRKKDQKNEVGQNEDPLNVYLTLTKKLTSKERK